MTCVRCTGPLVKPMFLPCGHSPRCQACHDVAAPCRCPICDRRYAPAACRLNLALVAALRDDLDHRNLMCVHCDRVLAQPVHLPCGHAVLCRPCGRDRAEKLSNCPRCREPVTKSMNALPEDLCLDARIRERFPDMLADRPRVDHLCPAERARGVARQARVAAEAGAPELLTNGYLDAVADVVRAHFHQDKAAAKTDLLRWCHCGLMCVPLGRAHRAAMRCPRRLADPKAGCDFVRFLSKPQRAALVDLL